MSEKEMYKLAVQDVNNKRMPLYSVLKAAEDMVAAEAYRRGWKDQTGEDLRYFRVASKR